MERLLHYVWRHKIFPLRPLQTTDGQPVEVIDTGLPNHDAGPDFFNAKLKIGETLWVGNVEVHSQASDWMRHGHNRDRAYDTVVLHVVERADCEVRRTDGEPIPQLQLPIPEAVRTRYATLLQAEVQPSCHSVLSSLSGLAVHSWLSALQMERFEQKSRVVAERLKRHTQHWEDVFFITLSRNFGFGLNGDTFEAWAENLPFRAIDKHRDDLFQVESIFFGQAGLLEDTPDDADEYYLKLRREFRYLQHKFTMPAPIAASRWKMLRTRPGNFPHVRLAQLAAIYHTRQSLFSRVIEAETLDDVRKLFSVKTSPYWDVHFHFRRQSPDRAKQLGKGALNLLAINTIVPVLYAYGLHKAAPLLCDRATRFLESIQAEDNYVTRLWSCVGLPVRTAADSQALLQLQKAYCDKKECLRCRFGYEYLKGGK